MDADSPTPVSIDAEIVLDMAAANGLMLSPEHASDLIPALQAILSADAQLAALDLTDFSPTGLPWDAWHGKGDG